MKKNLIRMVAAALMFCCAANVQAAGDEARAAQAQRDAVYSMQTVIDEMGPLFGLEITKEGTPEIYSILQDVCASCDSIYSGAKAKFNRRRPYAYYDEGTPATDATSGIVITNGQKVVNK